MRRSSWILCAAMAVPLTGCGPGEQPGPAPEATSVVPPVSYSGLRGECPTLESPAAERFTGSRKGRLLPLPRQPDAYEWINCSWRSPSAPAWVNLVIQIHRDGFAPTRTGHGNAEQSVAESVEGAAVRAGNDPSGALRAQARRAPAGPASLLADGAEESLAQSTAAGNVVVTVMLLKTGPQRAAGTVTGLTATADAITTEVIGQLVPE